MAVDRQERMVLEEEDEESRVGETQQAGMCGDDDTQNPHGNNGLGQLDLVGHTDESPTKTKSLEDDRRIDQVLREWDEKLYQRADDGGPELGMNNSDCLNVVNQLELDEAQKHTEQRSSSLSAPLGFEDSLCQAVRDSECRSEDGEKRQRAKQRGKQPRRTLKFSDRIKDRARKQKESSKGKKTLNNRIKEDEKIGFWRSTEDESEDSEDEIEDTWAVGIRLGLDTDVEDKAKKYLKTKAEEITDQMGNKGCARQTARGKKGEEEFEVRRMWGNIDFQWEGVNAVNNCGGLLCIWDKSFFRLEQISKGDRWMCLVGVLEELQQ
ncbi:hypothetical protein PIB30_004951 [Stylosanthes scabra]|uniref:Uncharacterized protein n=1 Tax=Stylosanthes scabra TaxID=79078 RepID=A0ABU6X5R4_9FABA|nr:hypothetical protein [Stylosanthes scabra]